MRWRANPFISFLFELCPAFFSFFFFLLLSSMKVSRYEHTGRLAEMVSSLSLSKSGAIWHMNAAKCRREIQIIARLERPPLRSGGVASRLINSGVTASYERHYFQHQPFSTAYGDINDSTHRALLRFKLYVSVV